MDRIAELLTYADKQKLGIEIGPYHSPLVPKSKGFHSTSIDVFDAEELRRRALSDPTISSEGVDRIEEVDIVGSAGDIAAHFAARFGDQQVDYIISSHNFEHFPDPIRFLQGCSKVLKPSGVLTMALPDRRYCFDYYRPSTELSEWLEGYYQQRSQPTAAQVFRGTHLRAQLGGISTWTPGEPRTPVPENTLDEAFATFQTTVLDPSTPYTDTHCSAFTPKTFELLMADVRYLGLTDLEPVRITKTYGCEFFVHLKKADPATAESAEEYQARRRELLREALHDQRDPRIPRTAIGRELRARQRLIRTSTRDFARKYRATSQMVDMLKRARDRWI